MKRTARGSWRTPPRRRPRAHFLLAAAWVVAAVSYVAVTYGQKPSQAAPREMLAYEVRRGDTFSGITARFTGDPTLWRRFYDPNRSGLDNPHLIYPNMWFEMVREPGRHPYLRVVKSPYETAETALARIRKARPVTVHVRPALPLVRRAVGPARG